jgi:hypothetical protein
MEVENNQNKEKDSNESEIDFYDTILVAIRLGLYFKTF